MIKKIILSLAVILITSTSSLYAAKLSANGATEIYLANKTDHITDGDGSSTMYPNTNVVFHGPYADEDEAYVPKYGTVDYATMTYNTQLQFYYYWKKDDSDSIYGSYTNVCNVKIQEDSTGNTTINIQPIAVMSGLQCVKSQDAAGNITIAITSK